MKEQLKILLTGIMFYTRIPVPKKLKYTEERLNRATKYFPLIGGIIGLFTAFVFWGANKFFPVDISVLLSMASGIILTGAFHEDGFADVCDGFGGGYSKEQRLKIMKDSRIGTYGTVGLVLILAVKFFTLRYFNPKIIVPLLILAHSLSRLMPVIVIYFSKYSRDDATSKIKPIGKKIKTGGFILAIVFGLLPFPFINYAEGLFIVPVLVIYTILMMKYFEKRVGGYTGDCLGSIQQVSEIIIYLGYLLITIKSPEIFKC